MVTLGVVVFAASSAICGLTPAGSLAEAWTVTFRVIQGAGGRPIPIQAGLAEPAAHRAREPSAASERVRALAGGSG